MTERTFPSGIRDAYPDELARVWRRAGGDWVVSSDEVLLADREGLSGTPLDAFDASHSGSSMDVEIASGEGIVVGVWVGKDTTTTLTLNTQTDNQTVYLGWAAEAGNDVLVGLDGAFSTAEPADQRIPIWEFDTDGSGVTNVRDLRPLGEQIDVRNTGSAAHADSADSADISRSLGGDGGDATMATELQANFHRIKELPNPDDDRDAIHQNYADRRYTRQTDESSLDVGSVGGYNENELTRTVNYPLPMTTIPPGDQAETNIVNFGDEVGKIRQCAGRTHDGEGANIRMVVRDLTNSAAIYVSEGGNGNSGFEPLSNPLEEISPAVNEVEFSLRNNTDAPIDYSANLIVTWVD